MVSHGSARMAAASADHHRVSSVKDNPDVLMSNIQFTTSSYGGGGGGGDVEASQYSFIKLIHELVKILQFLDFNVPSSTQ